MLAILDKVTYMNKRTIFDINKGDKKNGTQITIIGKFFPFPLGKMLLIPLVFPSVEFFQH